jgi:serine protease Do
MTNLRLNGAGVPGQRCAGILLGLTWALSAQGQTSAPSLEPDKLFEKLSPSIWVVTTFDAAEKRLAQGSAVVIEAGTLITNCHVLARARAVVVRRENIAYGATLEHADVERDLCQLQVKNFNAPAVELAPTTGLRVGQRVYAVGNPRGLEVTFSDGLISGLRKGSDDKTVELVQTSAPISPGSSGGGLFDGAGRLVGITTATRRDSQNLNFAMPADWIRDVPARAKEALAKRATGDSRTAGGAGQATRVGGRFVGQVFDYALIDRMTGLRQNVQLRVERLDGENVMFSGGRVETQQGKVVRSSAQTLSELDALNQLGGWAHGGMLGNRAWRIQTAADGRPTISLDLEAVFGGESRVTTPAGEFDVQVFRFSGVRQALFNGSAAARGTYEATVWFAPAINRVVRFVASAQGLSGRLSEEVVLERFDR